MYQRHQYHDAIAELIERWGMGEPNTYRLIGSLVVPKADDCDDAGEILQDEASRGTNLLDLLSPPERSIQVPPLALISA